MSETGTTTVRSMPNHRGGRRPDYTPAEDAIILRYTDTKECQEKLREAGFSERTPAALWSRRDYLRRAGHTDADISVLEQSEEARILFARRSKLRERLTMLTEEVLALQAEIDDLTERLRGLV